MCKDREKHLSHKGLVAQQYCYHASLLVCGRLKLCALSMHGGRNMVVKLTVVALLAMTVLPWHELAVTGSAPNVDVEDDLEPQGVDPQARMRDTLQIRTKMAQAVTDPGCCLCIKDLSAQICCVAVCRC